MAIATGQSASSVAAVRRSVVLRFADSPDLLQVHDDGHVQPTAVALAATGTDAALVQPQTLFDQLTASSSSSTAHDGRAYIAIDLPRRLALRKTRDHLPSLVIPIVSAAKTAGANGSASKSADDAPSMPNGHAETSFAAEEPMIILPTLYRRFFGRGDRRLLDLSSLEVSVRSHVPLTLSHLVLAAQSSSAFAYAQQAQDVMEQQMHGRMLRQNDMISFGAETFAVAMSEPVLQGRMLRDATQVFVTFDERTAEMSTQQSHAQIATNGRHTDDNDDFDASNIVVDEHFFSKGVLDSLESNVDEANASMFADTSGTAFAPRPIADEDVVKDALQAYASRAWRDPAGFDVEDCVLLDESLFPRLGAFEGDWALVEVEGQGKARAVKMLCAPRGWSVAANDDNDDVEGLPLVHLSPLLLQNLHPLGQFDPSKRPFRPITLRSLGSWQMTNTERNRSDALPDCPLPLPFADSLTISRVAGPLSVNRKYQGLFLGALRTYFETSRRIVQQGDLFAVSFDKSKVQWAVEEVGNEESGEATAAATNGSTAAAWNSDDAYELSLPTPLPASDASDGADTSHNNAVVYFCVTDITPEVSEPSRSAEAQAAMQADSWIHEMARTGQFGCAVDTSLTKMVQSGVTQTRVIDTQSWLHIASDTPALPLSRSPLTTSDSLFGRLLRLMQATLMPNAAEYGLHLSVLLKGARGCGKRTLVRWVAQRTGVHIVELNCYDMVADSDARTEGVLRARFEQALACAPAIVLLRHVEALARKSQALETGQEPTMAAVLQDCLAGVRRQSLLCADGQQHMPVAVIGTTGDADRCPTGVLACFRHELTFEAPNEQERRAILDTCAAGSVLSVDVSLKSVATQTAALVASDLVDLVSRAQTAAVERVVRQQNDVATDLSIVEAGVALTGSDFDVALAKARLSYSENIGAPKIPNVTWDDVGGLASVKDDILDTIQLPLEHPELFSDGLKKRSGILLYGPPGTGKTLLAKAVATSCSLNFFSVKGPELLNMYIGESEANVRRVFQRARDAKPCVIFFDELDSIAPKRGNQGDSGGVMDRIVSQLLAELDGMSSGSATADVFVIGATNRPDLLDSALLRPGRFDRMLYLAVSGTHAEQLNILQALTRKFKLDDDVGDLSVIAEQCPMNLTGADFYALCSDAMLKSMTRKADWIDTQVSQLNDEAQQAKAAAEAAAAAGGKEAYTAPYPLPLTPQYYLDEMAEPATLEVKVSRADFESALSELVPSVSAQEMQHYRSVQQRFSSTDEKEEASEEDPADGVLHAPVEASRPATTRQQYDSRTVAEVMAALQNGMQLNGHSNGNGGHAEMSEVDEQQQRSQAKGKGKARAIDEEAP